MFAMKANKTFTKMFMVFMLTAVIMMLMFTAMVMMFMLTAIIISIHFYPPYQTRVIIFYILIGNMLV
ncbi:hypothetical protein, partial [Bacillus cereus group sp. BfR-BA-01355]|uniref:hypothetical protein n=1 Tax=Bacillus cereus group sp. BfR-BA-01355 TaxID=2920318 RepID=UPI001F56A2DA